VPVLEPAVLVDEPLVKSDVIEEPSAELVKLDPIEDIVYSFPEAALPDHRNNEVRLGGPTSLRLEVIEAA
jgi:hypothetical protein